MVRILSLDLGMKRTGVAFFDEQTNIPLPLTTLVHADDHDLVQQIIALARVRSVDRLLVGLPLLPSGTEGSQAKWVHTIVEQLTTNGFTVSLLDERFSTPIDHKSDPDAFAALNLLQIAIKRGI